MGAAHFQSRHWFCLTAGGKDNLASKSFVCMSDPQTLTLAFRLVRNRCTYEGMTEVFCRQPKARKHRSVAVVKKCRTRKVLQREPKTTRCTKTRFGTDMVVMPT